MTNLFPGGEREEAAKGVWIYTSFADERWSRDISDKFGAESMDNKPVILRERH